MSAIQLELDLWQQIAEAQQSPHEADWQQLCLAFDQLMAHTPLEQQLAIAAQAIEQLATLLADRAMGWFEDWQRSPDQGPVVDEDIFAGLVRQSMALDLDGLVAEPVLYRRHPSEPEARAGSVVEVKDKAVLLAELESIIDSSEQASVPDGSVAHDEDVTLWITLVQDWMESQTGVFFPLETLCRGVNLSIVPIWMALLLGEFQLEQQAEFYSLAGVRVCFSDFNAN